MSIEPTESQIQRMLDSDDSGPVVMVNLLRFRAQADGPHERTGFEAYAAYGERLTPLFAQVGAEIILVLDVAETMIGPGEGVWDLVVMVRYPSREAFMTMLSHPEYLDIHADRAAGLERAELLVCKEVGAAPDR